MNVSVPGFLRELVEGRFFHPVQEQREFLVPRGTEGRSVRFPAADGASLQGFLCEPPGATATVIHCHGSEGNAARLLGLVSFIAEAGFRLFTFDYRGYGQSDGAPTLKGIVEDTLSAVRFLRTSGGDRGPVALFGQSLGTLAAAGAMAEDRAVRCLVLEGGFTTSREMILEMARGRLAKMAARLVVDLGPLHSLGFIGPRPTLLIHGMADPIVPCRFAARLHEAFPATTEMALLPNMKHLNGLESGSLYTDTVVEFLRRKMDQHCSGGSLFEGDRWQQG